MKALKYFLTAAFTILIAMTSCKDEETKSRFGNKAYLSTGDKTTLMLIADDPEFTHNLTVSTAKPMEADASFTFRVAPDMVKHYNQAYYTEMELLPEEYYKIENATVTVPEGSARSTEFTITFNKVNEIDREKKYVLPVQVVSNSALDVIESNSTHYFLVKAGAIINWAADITGNYFPVNWTTMGAVQNLTYEAWIWLDNIDGRPDANIRSVIGAEGQVLLRTGDSFEVDQMQIVTPRGNYPSDAGERTRIPVKQWCHIALTCGVTDGTHVVKLYLDGELKSVSEMTPWTANLNSGFHIGKSYNDNRWWTGMITEVRVWNVERTRDQIVDNIYQVAADSEGLVAYWKFNEREGNTVMDQTGNGNNITSNSTLTWVNIQLPEMEEE